ncbi:acyl-CoA dehydrogenase family protein [Plantactinospora sp. GCM10030261]|uniref:acyl-CoA dehydrogenase family protein n=1 Tax=Plantactinospora sp. GCM10030261 TaxID=3273420 RepID=UPI0036203246
MFELDGRLTALRARAAEWGGDLAALAMDLDRDPDAVHGALDTPVMRHLATARYAPNGEPLTAGGHTFHLDTALEQVVFFEELAAADVGAILAAPGAPMAGPLVDLLGDDAQREWFFGALAERPTWVFFALTEPGHGSDAGGLETRLDPDGDDFRLTGAKRYVGNAPRARLGVVFARVRSGPLGVRAVLVEAPTPGLTVEPLTTIGLRGAALGSISMSAVAVGADRMLGRHLPATRRGVLSWVRVFNRIRPRVAAMGIGMARAACDYVRAHRRDLRPAERDRLDALDRRVEGVRQLNLAAARAVDADPADGALASAAKARAARLAEEATLAAPEFFGPGARLDHPYLGKLARDARGVEFMEGASNVQKLIVSQHLTRGGNRHDN